MEVLADWDVVRQGQGWRRLEFASGWHIAPELPDVRQRVEIWLGPELDEESVDIFLDLQRRRYGIWVERDEDWEIKNQAREELKKQILDRARALEHGL